MKKILVALLFSSPVFAVPLTVIPNSTADMVTAGIPLAPCVMTDTSTFKLLDAKGIEVPVFIKPTLTWPASRCGGAVSIRALKLQFAFGGKQTYDWQLAPRTLPDIAETAVVEVDASKPARAGFREPAHFAISEPEYLTTTQLLPPTNPAGKNAYDTGFFPAIFDMFSGRMNFSDHVSKSAATKSGVPENPLGLSIADWLFDRVSTLYRQALRTGNIDYYRDAYLSHEFWISKMEVTGTNTTVKDYCLGGFDYGRKAETYASGGDGCDSKYIYLSPWKLHLALTGDDSWTPQENGVPSPLVDTREKLVTYIAKMSLERGPATGLGKPYAINGVWTERDAGFALQALVAGYELTNDPAILADIKTAVGNMYKMATENPDGLGNNGYLSHSWDRHEGSSFLPWLGTVAVDLTDSIELLLSNTLGNGASLIKENSSIRIGKQDIAAAGPAQVTENGEWKITLKTPVTAKANATVLAALATFGDKNRNLEWRHATDRVFSPWMQAIIADGLWQLYNLTDDLELKTKSGEMLLGFGRAVTAYGLDGTGMNAKTKAAIESAFNVTIFDSGITAFTAGSALDRAPYTRYEANTLMATPAMNRAYAVYMFENGGFANQHIPEALFQIALGIKFETDPAKKAAMELVASDMLEWFEKFKATVSSSQPPRILNWGNKSDPWGTYDAVMRPFVSDDDSVVLRGQ